MSTPQIINRKTVECLLGQCGDDLYQHLQDHALFHLSTIIGFDPVGGYFYQMSHRAGLPADGSNLQIANASDLSNGPTLVVQIKTVDSTSYKGSVCFSIPMALLCETIKGNWVYRIGFSPASYASEVLMDHPSFSPFRVDRGYIGMTSRKNPFDRFREHYSKAKNGGGHLLHKAWRSIMSEVDVMVVFHVCAAIPSREAAFDVEEHLVDFHGTIAPHGLNVIAGGMKGIREMWRLGLMPKNGKPTDDQKDAALELLESDRSPVAAHYRTGHIRKLPAKCKAQTTWVSPCWVGMKEVYA